MVKVEGLTKLNLAAINQEAKTGPTLSQQMEKAPKLGFGNAFLIGLKAFGKSVTSEKTFSAIRSELKREVIDSKIEHRLQNLMSKFQGTNVEKFAVDGELRDQVMIRKLGLDTSPSFLQQSVDALEIRRFGDSKNSAPKSRMDVVLPDQKTAADPKALKAHFSNFIDRVQKELILGGVSKETQLKHFETLLTDFVANSLSLTEVQLFDQNKLGGVVRQFRDEKRTEKQQFMEVIKNVITSMHDPESKLSKKVSDISIYNLKSELKILSPVGEATFLRSTPANQLNMRIYTNGGETLTQASKNLAQKMPTNEKFETVCSFLESFELDKKPLPQFKQGTMTPDLMEAVGDLAVEMIDQLKATKDLDGLRKVLAEVRNTFIDEVVSGNVSEAVAQRGNQMLGESNILLRFVTPQLVIARFPENKKFEAAMMLAGNLVMNVANSAGTPIAYDKDTAAVFDQQSVRLKGKLGELLSSLNVPTPDELTQAITNKRHEITSGQLDNVVENLDGLLKGLPKAKSDGESTGDNTVQNTDGLKNPPQVDVASLTKIKIFGKPIPDNAPQKTDDPKSPPKPEVNRPPKIENPVDEYVIDENIGDLRGVNDDDIFDDDDVDEETKRLQALSDMNMLVPDNPPETKVSEEDKKRLQGRENESDPIVNTDK